jgi:hypothetical protein
MSPAGAKLEESSSLMIDRIDRLGFTNDAGELAGS